MRAEVYAVDSITLSPESDSDRAILRYVSDQRAERPLLVQSTSWCDGKQGQMTIGLGTVRPLDMERKRSQKILDIMFEVLSMVHARDRVPSEREELMEWARDQLCKCGISVQPMGLSHAVLVPVKG